MLLILGIISIFFYKFFAEKIIFWFRGKKNTKDRINVLNTSYSSMKDIKIYSGEQFFTKV